MLSIMTILHGQAAKRPKKASRQPSQWVRPSLRFVRTRKLMYGADLELSRASRSILPSCSSQCPFFVTRSIPQYTASSRRIVQILSTLQLCTWHKRRLNHGSPGHVSQASTGWWPLRLPGVELTQLQELAGIGGDTAFTKTEGEAQISRKLMNGLASRAFSYWDYTNYIQTAHLIRYSCWTNLRPWWSADNVQWPIQVRRPDECSSVQIQLSGPLRWR